MWPHVSLMRLKSSISKYTTDIGVCRAFARLNSTSSTSEMYLAAEESRQRVSMAGVRNIDVVERFELVRRVAFENRVPNPNHVFLGQRDLLAANRLVVDGRAVLRIHVGDLNLFAIEQ